MNLAIIGYGKMGHMIEALAPAAGFTICARVDSKTNTNALTHDSLNNAQVAIEFSQPSAAPTNIERLAAAGINIVSGTTGWHSELPRVRKAVELAGVSLVWSRNFSVGVNIFTRVVNEAARLLEVQPDFGAWAWELHHSAKKDAPSGTLLQLVEGMQRSGYTRPVSVSSSRAGSHPGEHEIGFDSQSDTITLRHSARAIAKDSHAALCLPRNGEWAAAAFMNLVMSYLAKKNTK